MPPFLGRYEQKTTHECKSSWNDQHYKFIGHGTVSFVRCCVAVTIFATSTRPVHSAYLAEGILASNNVERSRLPLGG